PGPPVAIPKTYFELLREPPGLARLRGWTEERLAELAASGALPSQVLRPGRRLADGTPHPDDHSAVAGALAGYLANNYAYTSTLERRHPGMDPVEEFLYETREGNCERFAAALMLMLRSLRIPSQVVLGFQGCDDLGDGTHEVRQNQAHSWVEVFLADTAVPADAATVAGRWMPVDATPAGGPVAPEESLLSRWAQVTQWFREFIVNSDGEQRERLLYAAWDAIVGTWQALVEEATGPNWPRFWAVVAGVLTGPLALRGAWRRARRRMGVPAGPGGGAFPAPPPARLGRAGVRPREGPSRLGV